MAIMTDMLHKHKGEKKTMYNIPYMHYVNWGCLFCLTRKINTKEIITGELSVYKLLLKVV